MANTTGLDRGAGAVLELIVGGAATAVDMFRVKNWNAFALLTSRMPLTRLLVCMMIDD